ncbi:PIR Superfamily Protein, partial [Plasmodium ovale curtisi]
KDFKPFLKSTKHYKYLDENYETVARPDKCILLRNEFNEYPNIYKFCMRLRGNLDYFEQLKSDNLFEKDKCQYFNCWIYDNLLKLGFDLDNTNSSSIINKIKQYFSEYDVPKDYQCELFDVDTNKYKKMKTLYDYALDFSIILFYIKEHGCSKENDKYVKNIRAIYEEVKSNCSKTDKESYCIVWEHINKVYKYENILELECKNIYDENPSLEAQEERQRGPQGDLEPERDTYLNASSNIGIALFFPFFGILITVLILYKFTPLRHKIHTFLRKNNLLSENMDNEIEGESLEGTSQYTERNSNGVRYFIDYQGAYD